MTGWILSIVGMVLTVTLTEIMLPEGQTAKYIKGVISLMVVYVVIAPIPALLSSKIDINSFFDFSSGSYESDQAFIEIIKEDKQSVLGKELTAYLKGEGLSASASVFLGEGDSVTLVALFCEAEDVDKAAALTMKSLGIKEDKLVIHEVFT